MKLATEPARTDNDEQDLLNSFFALGRLDDVIPKLARDRAAIRKIEAAVRRLSTSHDLILGDARAASALPERSVHLVVTSPPIGRSSATMSTRHSLATSPIMTILSRPSTRCGRTASGHSFPAAG